MTGTPAIPRKPGVETVMRYSSFQSTPQASVPAESVVVKSEPSLEKLSPFLPED